MVSGAFFDSLNMVYYKNAVKKFFPRPRSKTFAFFVRGFFHFVPVRRQSLDHGHKRAALAAAVASIRGESAKRNAARGTNHARVFVCISRQRYRCAFC
jgi:hypothetical protein